MGMFEGIVVQTAREAWALSLKHWKSVWGLGNGSVKRVGGC